MLGFGVGFRPLHEAMKPQASAVVAHVMVLYPCSSQ